MPQASKCSIQSKGILMRLRLMEKRNIPGCEFHAFILACRTACQKLSILPFSQAIFP
jgi:hypothetical protein